jgi:nitrite reductase/ring-hydroxylating ferredoxin subunit
MDNHHLECSLQAGAFAYADGAWLEGRGSGKVEQKPLNEKGDTCCN